MNDFNMVQSTCMRIVRDRILGYNFIDILNLFENNEQTDTILITGVDNIQKKKQQQNLLNIV